MSGTGASGLFDSVSPTALPSIWDAAAKDINAPEVFKLLELSNKDLAKAGGLPVAAMKGVLKSGKPLPEQLIRQAREWAKILFLVGQHFGGDVEKTVLWFRSSNPLLGGFSPKDMIQFGRARKLHDIVEDALVGNLP